MNRRRLLRAAGALSLAGLAGCVGGRRDGGGDGPADPPTTFTALGSRCGGQTDRASVSYAGGVVTVEGTTWGNDGCYLARLDEVTLDGGTLTVRVGAERDDEKEACVQCITELDYRLEVAVEPRPEQVVVVHRGERVTAVRP